MCTKVVLVPFTTCSKRLVNVRYRTFSPSYIGQTLYLLIGTYQNLRPMDLQESVAGDIKLGE
jgi:hypothetical protein